MESLPPNDGSIAGTEPTIEGFVTVSGMGAQSSFACQNFANRGNAVYRAVDYNCDARGNAPPIACRDQSNVG
jgi:hypothetical protein